MSRRMRIISDTGMYHIILRGVNQQVIFEEPADYYKFLSVMDYCKKKYGFSLHAYCLMSNHVHLLMTIDLDLMSSVFQSFGSIFVKWYNMKYRRTGYLFQDRFSSFPVNTLSYFLNSIQYIHDNPMKAGACRFPTEYPWSSCKCYYGTEDPLVDTELADEVMESRANLLHFFSVNKNEIKEEDLKDMRMVPAGFIDEEALLMFQTITECRSPSDFQHLPRKNRNDLIEVLVKNGLSQRQVARFGGISVTTVQRVMRCIRERKNNK